MCPSADLSELTFARLQKLAVPLVDSIDTVIAKLLDFYDSGRTLPEHSKSDDRRQLQRFRAGSPPDLTHTKVLSATLAGVAISNATWNGILFELIRRAKRRIANTEEAKRLLVINFVRGKKEDEGFRFVPEVGISVQGQDANYAWRGAFHLATQLELPLEVEFMWRSKDAAAFPGKSGRLTA